MRILVVLGAALVVAGCRGDSPAAPQRAPTPAIEAAEVAPNPYNALSAVVAPSASGPSTRPAWKRSDDYVVAASPLCSRQEAP